MLDQYCGQEFTAAHRDADANLSKVKDNVDAENYKQLEQILSDGCLAKFGRFFYKAY